MAIEAMVGVVKAAFNLFGRSHLSLLKIPSEPQFEQLGELLSH